MNRITSCVLMTKFPFRGETLNTQHFLSNIVAPLSPATPCFVGFLFLPMIYRHLEAFQGETKMASWSIFTKRFSFLWRLSGSEADDNVEEAPTPNLLQGPVLSRKSSRRGTLSMYRGINRDYFMKNARVQFLFTS